MEAFLAHAIIDPVAASAGDRADARAARSLSLQLLALVQERPLLRTWRARAADETAAALVVIADEATAPERELFAATAERLATAPLEGVIHARALAPSRDAFATEMWTTGYANDLQAFSWTPRRRLEFLLQVARALEALHRAGILHGCLCPENVALDDDLHPILTEAGMVSIAHLQARGVDVKGYLAFASPEVRRGEAPSVRSDVWSLGCWASQLVPTAEVPEITLVAQRCMPAAGESGFARAADVATALEALVSSLVGDRSSGSTRRDPKTVSPQAPAAPRTPAVRAAARTSGRTGEAPNPLAVLNAPRVALGLGVVGALATFTALAGSFVLGGANEGGRGSLQGLLLCGVALASWLVPPLSRRPIVGRLALAAACVAAMTMVDPVGWGLRTAAHARLRGAPSGRRLAVMDLVDLGRDLRGVKLEGTDLSGLDLTAVDLRDADLSRADLTGARLWAAQLERASLEGARLARADLQESTLDEAYHADSAECDKDTRLPGGWRCLSGKLVRSR